jgi:hypothetical protein
MSLDKQNPKRVRRRVAAALGISLVLFLILYFSIRPNSDRANAEQYFVYSDYLAQGLSGESHSLGTREGIIVIYARTTSGPVNYRFLFGSFRHAKRNSPLSSHQPLANLLFSNLISKQLQRSFVLPANYALMTDSELALYPTESFWKQFPGNYGYHTFTRVGFNRQLTEAIFYTEHICGLCGEGKYVYMRKLDGKWVMVGEDVRWVS